MSDHDTNDRVIKSYVWHDDKCFFVSTIERDSSAAAGPRRYNETIVWAFDWSKNERGEPLWQTDDVRGSVHRHTQVCIRLHRDGTLND